MTRLLHLFAFALIGCAPVAENASVTPVWGVDALPDLDPEPGVVEVELTAGLSSVAMMDGTATEVWAYNGQVPGPLIQAQVGDLVRVRFTNNLPERTTVHWHGLRIDNLMDGVPAVQTPVKPGESFTYEFTVPDAGSYWYHPHVRSYDQIERGLQGVLVVHEADVPTPARDRYFVLDDIALTDDAAIYDASTDGMTGVHGRFGNVLLVNGQAHKLEEIVRPRASERWRLVNTANARPFYVSVANADWRVIAIDGTLLPEPYMPEFAELPVGRRVDLEVIPKAGAEKVRLQVHESDGQGGVTSDTLFRGVVAGVPGNGRWLDWNAPELPPIHDPVDTLDMSFDARQTVGGELEWVINGATFADDEDIYVRQGVPTRIVLTNEQAQFHPFHLHGDFFQVVERNGEPTFEPGLMDTVMLWGEDELVIQTDFTNPGRWMAHCHILEHAELGMMTEIVVE